MLFYFIIFSSFLFIYDLLYFLLVSKRSICNYRTIYNKALQFRTGVVNHVEDYLLGFVYDSWLPMYLAREVENELPEAWIRNAGTLKTVILPVMYRWIQYVKLRFAQRHPAVPREILLHRSAKLKDTMKEVALICLSAQAMYRRDTMRGEMDMNMDVDVPPSIDSDQDKLPSDIGLHISEDLESSGKIATTTEAAICTGT